VKRREFIVALGAIGSYPGAAFAQQSPRFADMHSHVMIRQGLSREALAQHGMLVVAEKIIPDYALIRPMGGKLGVFRDAQPGEMRRGFETQLERMRARIASEAIPLVDSVAALDKVVRERTPGVAISSEGADFLEGDLAYLEKMRKIGLVHLQLVHYRISDVGDISTEEPRHGGLTAFGKDVVRACNRLGILVDMAHLTVGGMEHALEISTRPVVYSHGFISAELPRPNDRRARAIHMPLARAVAAKGGIVGLWPLGAMYPDRPRYADALARACEALGPAHVGIGSDINGLPSTSLPTHAEFAEVAELLAKRGLKDADVAGVMGGNYIRVLREAMNI